MQYDGTVITHQDDVQIILNGVANTDYDTLESKWQAVNDEVWVRFQGSRIPRGSKIVSAVLKLYGKSSAGSVSLGIKAEAAGNSAQPTLADTPTSRNWGSLAANTWVVPAWTDLSLNSSPDIADIIQELVRRSDWTGDDPLFGDFMLQLKATSIGSKGSQRTAYAFDHDNNGVSPEITIVFTPPPPPQGQILG